MQQKLGFGSLVFLGSMSLNSHVGCLWDICHRASKEEI